MPTPYPGSANSTSPSKLLVPTLIKYSHNPFFQVFWETFRFKILEHGITEIDSFWNKKRDPLPYNRLHFSFGEGGALLDATSETPFKPGLMILTPFQTACEQVYKSKFEVFYIHFRLSAGASIDLLGGLKKNLSTQLLEEDLRQIKKLLAVNSFGNALTLQNLLLSWLLPLIAPYEKSIQNQFNIAASYKEFFHLMEQDLSADLSVENLVSRFVTDVDRFARQFKKDTGKTLLAQRNLMLIEKAQTQLLLSEESIKSIAHQLGFEDELYFSRFFKKHTHRSPLEYRKLFTQLGSP